MSFLLGKAHPSQSPLRNVAAGPLTAETPRSPESTLFLCSSHITVYHLPQPGFCSGPRPRNFGRGRERGACRKLPVPLLGQESKPCCGSHRNNKESLSWHRAESSRWIRRISRYAGVSPQASLSSSQPDLEHVAFQGSRREWAYQLSLPNMENTSQTLI